MLPSGYFTAIISIQPLRVAFFFKNNNIIELLLLFKKIIYI